MMTRRLLGWMVLVLGLAVGADQPVSAQVIDSVTMTAANASCLASNCVSVGARGVPVFGINVAGGGTFTLHVEVTRDGGLTWHDVPFLDDGDPDAIASAIAAAGSFSLNNSGFTALRVRAESLDSGTPVVTITRGEVAALDALGGGGGGGGSNTEYTEAATDASITGIAALMEVSGDALRPLQGSVADGLLVNLGANNDVTVSGSVTVTDGSGALNVIVDSGSVTANAGTNLNTSALALESGGNLAAAATSLGTLDNAVAGNELQVDVITMPTVTVTDGSGAMTVDGSVSCSNCSGSGASDVDDSSFTIGTDSVAPAGFLFDDVTPDSVDEGDTGLARMSANRVQFGIIRDGAAGAERGASVTANNELLVELGAGAASIGVLGANSGVDIGDVTINNASGAAAVNIQDGGNTITVDGSVSCSNCSGSGASFVDDAAFTVATDSGAPMMGIVTTDAVSSGDVGVVGMLTNRQLKVTLYDSGGSELAVGGGTQYTEGDTDASVTGTALLFESNTGTNALSVVSNSAPLPISDAGGAITVDGTVTANLSATDNAVLDDIADGIAVTQSGTWNVTNVSGTVSLPTGASTAANQTTIAGHVDGVEGLLGTIDADTGGILTAVQLLDNAISGNEMQVDVLTMPTVTVTATNLDVQIGGSDTLSVQSNGANLATQTTAAAIQTAVENLATYLQPGSIALIRSDNTNNDDETQIKGSAGVLLSISGRNSSADTDAFVRCVNQVAASTTPGSTTVVYEMLLPYGGGFVQGSLGPAGVTFSTGITCYLATGVAVSDTTDPAENAVVVNVVYR